MHHATSVLHHGRVRAISSSSLPHMKKLLWTAVVAATAPAPRRGIGLQGGLPWKIPGDLKHFRTITSRTKDPAKRNAVVMGRLTWESSEVKCRPLPKRLNVVISTTLAPREDDNVVIVPSLDAAVALMGTPKYTDTIETVHIVGGGQIYAEALKKRLCDYVYLTEVLYPPRSQTANWVLDFPGRGVRRIPARRKHREFRVRARPHQHRDPRPRRPRGERVHVPVPGLQAWPCCCC